MNFVSVEFFAIFDAPSPNFLSVNDSLEPGSLEDFKTFLLMVFLLAFLCVYELMICLSYTNKNLKK